LLIAISQLLDVLEQVGLIRSERRGRCKFHEIDTAPLERIVDRWLHDITGRRLRIEVTSVLVDDQDKALHFYTDVLGFQKKTEIPLRPRSELGTSRHPPRVADEVRPSRRCARDDRGRSCLHENDTCFPSTQGDRGRGPDEALRDGAGGR
jgi:hypothetical protein